MKHNSFLVSTEKTYHDTMAGVTEYIVANIYYYINKGIVDS